MFDVLQSSFKKDDNVVKIGKSDLPFHCRNYDVYNMLESPKRSFKSTNTQMKRNSPWCEVNEDFIVIFFVLLDLPVS